MEMFMFAAMLGALIFICVIVPPILIEIGYNIDAENQRSYNVRPLLITQRYNDQQAKRRSMSESVIACIVVWLLLCAGLVGLLIYASTEHSLSWIWITCIAVLAIILNWLMINRNESFV